ncbi:hypothetical protein [Methylocystis iwaonis]|uniref:hypothetical protein n=1 Tax=Methylocystis iwaonis TaxID=2885079 RepID=UPI002E7C0A64|nr:hypothetical protein [Methylocystis iwaonis]
MPHVPDDVYSKRTRSIADNLQKELKRVAAEAPWRQVQDFVDLLGVAQIVYGLEEAASPEGKEAEMLRAAALRFERLLHRKRDRLARENPFMTKDARTRFDSDIEVVHRYTHALSAEARVALAVRDAFDCANESYPGRDKIPTSLTPDGPLIALTCAALEFTPVRDKAPQALCKALEKWPVLRRQKKEG